MNKIGLNILAVALLSGCMNRTDSKGQKVSSNAPMFITPNTNATHVNKPKVNEVAPNKPAQVTFNAESYVMVKEKDLNMLVAQKTNENLLNIKKSNANAPQPNKELDAAIDAHIEHKKSNDSTEGSLTANVIQLAPVAQEKALGNPTAIHPVFAFIMTTLIILAFILTVGYFFFIKKKASHEDSTATKATAAQPTPPKVATETAAPAAGETTAETATKN